MTMLTLKADQSVEETTVRRLRRKKPIQVDTFMDHFRDEFHDVNYEAVKPAFIRDLIEDGDEWMLSKKSVWYHHTLPYVPSPTYLSSEV